MGNQIYIAFGLPQECEEQRETFLVTVTLLNPNLSVDDVLNGAIQAVEKQNENEDIEIPYPYNWGDVFNEGTNDYFSQYGFTVDNTDVIPTFWHDEIVIEN